MNRLKTKYLGLNLKNPIILSSSGLTSSLERIKSAEEAGVGAVVLKSIFEEQILSEVANVDSYSDYPEAADYLREYMTDNSLGNYVKLIQDIKRECTIPVIASINCIDGGHWVDFAQVIETAGADAIEINIFHLSTDKNLSSEVIEKNYLDTIGSIRDAITIPLSVKLASGFTNPLSIVREIYYRNIQGVVLFNRFYAPDIDIEDMTMKSAGVFSSQTELPNIIRWTGLISGSFPLIDIAASTGAHSGEDVIKLMLAGATAAELCSAIYEKGLSVIPEMLEFMKEWMTRHSFNDTKSFVGSMNVANIDSTVAYERTQFMKYYSNLR